MCVHTPSRKSWEWLTMRRMRFHLDRYSSSQSTASMSRWLVGSSRSRHAGFMKRALASATLILHPPEKSFVILPCISWVKPRPLRMERARTSAVEASISSRRSYTMLRSSMIFSCFSSSSSSSVRMLLRSSASFSSLSLSSSTLMTASKAVVSDAATSSFRWKMSMPSGMGTARAPKAFKSVLLPLPLLPMRPYLFP
mmetsp:Transcript_30002/g.59592  ORF Transcript_30002/g.59592 Transcript_30002/m.59592 type:complete len:197 (-) Transcript_30002:333-923(-)